MTAGRFDAQFRKPSTILVPVAKNSVCARRGTAEDEKPWRKPERQGSGGEYEEE